MARPKAEAQGLPVSSTTVLRGCHPLIDPANRGGGACQNNTMLDELHAKRSGSRLRTPAVLDDAAEHRPLAGSHQAAAAKTGSRVVISWPSRVRAIAARSKACK